MDAVEEGLVEVVERNGFSGAVRLDRGAEVVLSRAFGFAERGLAVANTPGTQFAVASATKGLTALTVVSLVEEGVLELGTPVRPLLGDDLREVDDAVTVEHLLSHRSGIGDYVDEDEDLELSDYLMPVPVHALATTEGYLTALAGHAQKFAPGTGFSYCNSGYVVLALVAERVTGTPFHDLVEQRVCAPAGLHDTAFLRSDELPGTAARGYLSSDGLRTNVLHLPVRGSGDGGIYTSVGDVHALWRAFLAGQVVGSSWVEEMLRPRSEVAGSRPRRYGLGFWLLDPEGTVMLEGLDAGVSFRSVHDPGAATTYTVVANDGAGAWPVARYLDEVLSG